MSQIAERIVQIPVNMLQRYQAGRVQPYTILLAEAMGMTFHMSLEGRGNLDDALSKLPAHQILGKGLEIGFGIEDITKHLAKSEGGSMTLGLCAALQDCYLDDLAVEILLEYARATKATDDSWMPSNMEWRALLDACAGCLAASNFSIVAEMLMRLCGKEGAGARYSLKQSPVRGGRGCSAPKSIATALYHLADLSRKEITAVTLSGGPDVGWIAAVAHWLLGLRVLIRVHGTEEVRFCNFKDDEHPQVLIYCRQDHPLPTEAEANPALRGITVGNAAPSNTMPSAQLTVNMNIEDTTRLVDLEDISSVLQLDLREKPRPVVCGRLEWKTALRSTFLADFDGLMELQVTFGSLLGSAMRITHELVNPDGTLSRSSSQVSDYCESSYGEGLLHHSITLFPELRCLQSHMAAACRKSLKEAQANYESCTSTLRSHCNCKLCESDLRRLQNNGNYAAEAYLSDDEDSAASTRSTYDPDTGFCKVIITETVIYLCRLLANVQLLCDSLTPTRSGIELAYERLAGQRVFYGLQSPDSNKLGPACFWVHAAENFLAGETPWHQRGIEKRISAILDVFTGREGPHTSSVGSQTCATWRSGLTAYLDLITNESWDHRGDVSKIKVMPGRIFFNTKAYMRITDDARHARSKTALLNIDDMQSTFAVEDTFFRDGLSLQESANDLRCSISFSAKQSDLRPLPPTIGPSALAWTLASRRGHIICKNRGKTPCFKRPIAESWRTFQVGNGHVQYQNADRTVHFWQATSGRHFGVILSMVLAGGLQLLNTIRIVDKECQDCCLVHAQSYQGASRVFCIIQAAST